MPVKAGSFCLLCTPFPMANTSRDTAGTADRDWPQDWLEGHSTSSDIIFSNKSLAKEGERGQYLWFWHLCSWVTLKLAAGSGYTPAWLGGSSKLIRTLLCAHNFCFTYQTVSVSLSESSSLCFLASAAGSTHCSRVLQNLLENSEFGGSECFLDKLSLYPVIVLSDMFVFTSM